MAGVAGLNSLNEINGCDAEKASIDPAETAVTPNDCRTSGDTGLTQRRSPDVLRDLLVKRNLVDAESREGRLLSNIIKIALWHEEPDSERSWAKHPTQNRPWMMKVQVEALAKGK